MEPRDEILALWALGLLDDRLAILALRILDGDIDLRERDDDRSDGSHGSAQQIAAATAGRHLSRFLQWFLLLRATSAPAAWRR